MGNAESAEAGAGGGASSEAGAGSGASLEEDWSNYDSAPPESGGNKAEFSGGVVANANGKFVLFCKKCTPKDQKLGGKVKLEEKADDKELRELLKKIGYDCKAGGDLRDEVKKFKNKLSIEVCGAAKIAQTKCLEEASQKAKDVSICLDEVEKTQKKLDRLKRDLKGKLDKAHILNEKAGILLNAQQRGKKIRCEEITQQIIEPPAKKRKAIVEGDAGGGGGGASLEVGEEELEGGASAEEPSSAELGP